MTKENKWHKITNGLKSEHKLTVEKLLDNQVKYSNRIRNRLFALKVKIRAINPHAHINIDVLTNTITVDGDFKFHDFKQIAKYVSKIEIILNRNKYGAN